VFESAIHGTARRDYSQAAGRRLGAARYDPALWALRVRASRRSSRGRRPRSRLRRRAASGYIDHFYVAAEAGGQGVGGALMRRILARADELGLAN
jgi:putative acetyltransferase